MKSKISIRESKIEGKGLFASAPFKKGEVVGMLRGPVVQFHVTNKEESLSFPNWFGYDKNKWIEPKEPFVFLNHSCNPNIGMKGRRTIVAMRNIKPNEELLIDYSIIEGDELWEMPCRCQYSKCRQVIRSTHFLPKHTFLKYMNWMPDYFKKLHHAHKSHKTNGVRQKI